jgi:hypothetical protein
MAQEETVPYKVRQSKYWPFYVEVGSWIISKMPSYDKYKGQSIIVDIENPERVTERLLSEMQISAVARDQNLTQISSTTGCYLINAL